MHQWHLNLPHNRKFINNFCGLSIYNLVLDLWECFEDQRKHQIFGSSDHNVMLFSCNGSCSTVYGMRVKTTFLTGTHICCSIVVNRFDCFVTKGYFYFVFREVEVII